MRARATPQGEALSRFAIDLALSFDARGPRIALLAALALLLFVALLVVSFRGPLRPVAAVLVTGLLALLAALELLPQHSDVAVYVAFLVFLVAWAALNRLGNRYARENAGPNLALAKCQRFQ